MLNYNSKNTKFSRRVIMSIKSISIALATLDYFQTNSKYLTAILVTGFVCTEIITLLSKDKTEILTNPKKTKKNGNNKTN